MNRGVVFVGLSGGVDSAVAALRLSRAGYTVVGVFIKVWQPDFLRCGWEQERLDAMRVAAHLGIPFLTCNAEEAYKREVGDYFVDEYRAGRTPNPDVLCNKEVKFKAFLEFALNQRADYIATGHYVRRGRVNDDTFQLKRGLDQEKDQSYFLWTLNQTQLAHSLFPIGVSTKEVVRQEAKRAGLPTARKKDSQGVCFLGQIDIPEFLGHFVELNSGPVLNTAGEEIGQHQGALVYTLGQRHGFSITKPDDQRQIYYVIDKDIDRNTITVDTTPLTLSQATEVKIRNTNWISQTPVLTEYTAQFRYRQTPIPVTLTALGNRTATVKLKTDTKKPAPGQSAVLYTGDNCLGGGIIQ